MVEKLFYETKPFIFVAMGWIAIHTQTMLSIGRVPATVLMFCGLLVLVMRLAYRGYLGDKTKSRHKRKF